MRRDRKACDGANSAQFRCFPQKARRRCAILCARPPIPLLCVQRGDPNRLLHTDTHKRELFAAENLPRARGAARLSDRPARHRVQDQQPRKCRRANFEGNAVSSSRARRGMYAGRF